jgi:hypothetical protein
MRLVSALKVAIAVESGCAALVWGAFIGVELSGGALASAPAGVGRPAPPVQSTAGNQSGDAGGPRLPAAFDAPAQLSPSPPAYTAVPPSTTPTTTTLPAPPTTAATIRATPPPESTTTTTTVPPPTTTTAPPPTTAPSPPSTTAPH